MWQSQAVLAQPFWKRRWTIVTLCFVAFMLCNMVRELHTWPSVRSNLGKNDVELSDLHKRWHALLIKGLIAGMLAMRKRSRCNQCFH